MDARRAAHRVNLCDSVAACNSGIRVELLGPTGILLTKVLLLQERASYGTSNYAKGCTYSLVQASRERAVLAFDHMNGGNNN